MALTGLGPSQLGRLAHLHSFGHRPLVLPILLIIASSIIGAFTVAIAVGTSAFTTTTVVVVVRA